MKKQEESWRNVDLFEMIPRTEEFTRLMMKRLVARADRGEEMSQELRYLVESFRAFLAGKSIRSALHLDKRDKWKEKKKNRERDFRAAAMVLHFTEHEGMTREEAYHAADKAIAGISEDAIKKAFLKRRGEVEMLHRSFTDPLAPMSLSYHDYLQAIADQKLTYSYIVRHLILT
jgi:hypothetical protein